MWAAVRDNKGAGTGMGIRCAGVVRTALIMVVVAGCLGAPAPAAAAAPANDNFSAATALPAAGGASTHSNVDASAEAGEPDHAASTYGAVHSVWFNWTPTASGAAAIDTCNSAFNTRMAVYTGDAVGSLTQVAANEDSAGSVCPGTKFAELGFEATAGTTYRIAVDTSGDLAGDGSGPPLGEIKLNLAAPAAPPAPEDPDTNPGTPVTDRPFTFTMRRLKPDCREVAGTADDCPRKNRSLRFTSLRRARSYVAALQAQGADILLRENPKPSSGLDGDTLDAIREDGVGGEILSQRIQPGESVTTTASSPRILKLGYYEPAEDKKIEDAIREALEKAGKKKKNVKSKCDFIATDAPPDKIETELAKLVGSTYLTQQRAGEILASRGCGYEVTKYTEAPGSPVDFVKDVVGVDRGRDLIQLHVALPVAQDFLLVVREDPARIGVDSLGPGTDGALTESGSQLNELTVQVVERSTGRLVSGVDVSFIGKDGTPQTKASDALGEVSFESQLRRADNYAITARLTAGGLTMVGFRSIAVKDRKGGTLTTMSGRSLTANGKGEYRGTAADLARSRSLPLVPANLGTGLSGPPTRAPKIEQGLVASPTANGLVAGRQNVVSIADDTNFTVGAAPGLLALGGGLPTSMGRETGPRAFPNPFAQVANLLNGIVTGLKRVLTGDSKGTGTAAERLTPAQEQAIAQTADRLTANGAKPPAAGLISDKGLGLISKDGGNFVAKSSGTIVPLSGLALRDASGKLIGQAGGNVIGPVAST